MLRSFCDDVGLLKTGIGLRVPSFAVVSGKRLRSSESSRSRSELRNGQQNQRFSESAPQYRG